MANQVADGMQTSTSVRCMKCFLMIFNVYICISGLIIFSLGLWLEVDLHKSLELSSHDNSQTATFLIVVGLFVMFMGIFGCICTSKEISSLLYCYGAVLLLIFILDLAVSISAFVYRDEIKQGFRDGLDEAIRDYETHGDKRKAMDKLQENLECCGRDGYEDWFGVLGTNTSSNVPKSCCEVEEKHCQYENLKTQNGTVTSDIFTEGCESKITRFMEKNFAAIGAVSVTFCFIQLFGAFASYCLAKQINKAKYERVS